MLREIKIENVAVIEKATAGFSSGFTALTGETGAGKSIMIDSINAILGNRTSKDIVRSGAPKACIWAHFDDLPASVRTQLNEAGYDGEDELLIYREINAEGKSVCRINGAPATASMLRELCSGLIDIHGQHDNQSLLNPAKHVGILDTFAQNHTLLEAYSKAYSSWQALKREISELSMDEDEKARKLDLLQYEVDEIEAAGLAPEEEETLTEQRNLARNSQDIMQALNNAYLALDGGEEGLGAVTLLGDAMNEITRAAGLVSGLSQYADTLNDAYYNMRELASDLSNKLSDYEYGDLSLEEIEERLHLIYRLKQKYGDSVEDILAYGQRAKDQLDSIQFSEEKLQTLATQEAAAQKKVAKLADELTETRQSAFEKLNGEISGALAFLNMPGIAMVLHRQATAFGPSGQDEMEFYISTNPGETPKPMAKIASGGELARIMLAIKSALAGRDDVPTVIYDEIDTGISGLAAGRVGQLMRDTAKGRQVICVTHTAQIAAFAQSHLLIEKQVEGGRTYTNIRSLDRQERIEELARIISGDKVTDTALANAQEMLDTNSAGA